MVRSEEENQSSVITTHEQGTQAGSKQHSVYRKDNIIGAVQIAATASDPVDGQKQLFRLLENN